MSRRVIAKKNIPASFRAWVKNFQGKSLVHEYRKHYHVSWSCAIVELSMLGVPFPAEELEDAKHRQVLAANSVKARKEKKAKAKELARISEQLLKNSLRRDESGEYYYEYDAYKEESDWVWNYHPDINLLQNGTDERVPYLDKTVKGSKEYDPYLNSILNGNDDYDPFTD